MTDRGKAVFLSYASQDAEAAKRICDALRAAGVEVWFDQSELRGGDAWDAMIRKRIKECALFVPVITPNTNARPEGYFRLEWKLAVDRSHLMADDAPFLFPIVVGDVTDTTARVPDKFRDVQWTRLRLDETPGELAGRVARLLAGNSLEPGRPRPGSRGEGAAAPANHRVARWQWWMIFPIIGTIMGLMFAAIPLWKMIQGPPPKRPPQLQTPDPKPQTPTLSPARQLAERARALSLDQYNSTVSDYATAEGLIQKAVEMDPNDTEIWAIASLFHTSIRTRGFDQTSGRREQARSAAERAIKLAPDSVNALFALGRTQRDSDGAAAELTFKRILALDPNHADAMSQLGWMCDLTDRFDEALAFYDRVLELDPQDAPLTHYLRYLLFFHYGRFAEAEAEIRRSVALQPSANSITGQAMVALTWRGDAEAAARALAAAPAELQSQTRLIWIGAIVHLARHDPAEVLRTLSRTETDYLQDNWFAGPKALFAGLAHRQAGRHEAARVAWESALAVVDARMKTAPDSRALHLARGQLLAWLGRTDEARREARTLEEMNRAPAAADWIFAPMMVHAALGDAAAVVPQLEQALAWDGKKNIGWPLTPALLRVDARWDALRSDPRFQKLCEERPGKSAVALSPTREVSALVRQGREMLEKYITDDTQRETLSLAEELVKRAVQADVTDADAWSLTAQVASSYIVSGRDRLPARYAAMNSAAEKAMQLAPKSDEALYARAVAYRLQSTTRTEAERLLRELLARNPADRRMIRMLGNVLQNRQAYGDALMAYRQAAALPGGDARAELYCAEMLLKMNRHDEAEAAAERSLAVQPTGTTWLFKVNLARLRGDLARARAELAKVPPAVLLDDRGASVAANVWLWSREPEKVIAALEVIPGDDLYNAFFYGPKSLMLGFAHQLAGREAVAKVQWRIASKNLEARVAADPSMAINPLYLGTKMFLDFLIGDPNRKAEAEQMLRLYVQIGVTVDMDPAWDPAKIFTLLGRQDIMIDLAEMMLKSGEMPGLREQLRTDQRYAPLRGNPRFDALLKEPSSSAKATEDREAKKE